MITVRIKGGLGNQLFQYASAYSLSRRLNQPLQLDTSFFPEQTLRGYKLEFLNIELKDIASKLPFPIELLKNKYINKAFRKLHSTIPLKKPVYLLENKSDIVDEFFAIESKDVYIDGYYQSEKYFKEYRDSIIKQFSINYEESTEYHEILNEIVSTNSVAVHVRRGDFLKAQYNYNSNHYLLSEQYYFNALEYIDSILVNPTYFWFSDDIEWVKRNFSERINFRFVTMRTPNADIDELMLMKNCKNIIAANSTFSWWASWLNDNPEAIHVCPEKRYGNANMIPDDWVKISVE
jgi:hypothetical protein